MDKRRKITFQLSADSSNTFLPTDRSTRGSSLVASLSEVSTIAGWNEGNNASLGDSNIVNRIPTPKISPQNLTKPSSMKQMNRSDIKLDGGELPTLTKSPGMISTSPTTTPSSVPSYPFLPIPSPEVCFLQQDNIVDFGSSTSFLPENAKRYYRSPPKPVRPPPKEKTLYQDNIYGSPETGTFGPNKNIYQVLPLLYEPQRGNKFMNMSKSFPMESCQVQTEGSVGRKSPLRRLRDKSPVCFCDDFEREPYVARVDPLEVRVAWEKSFPVDKDNQLQEYFVSPFNFCDPMLSRNMKKLCGNQKVLIFFAFYQENVAESPQENYRIHQVKINYFIEDDTICVFEPHTYDPGFIQGKIIKRGRIPLPSPNENFYYKVDHFNVGCQVTLYGKTFFICGVDDCTRKILNRMGITVPENLEMPVDPCTKSRKDAKESLFGRLGHLDLSCQKGRKYLENYRKVLRFWAYWDASENDAEVIRYFVLHYHLQDDTVEISEIDPTRKSKIPTVFLGRGKLLKNHFDLVTAPGGKDDAIMILNPAGMDTPTSKLVHLKDRMITDIDWKNYYTAKDLAIGAVINVYGRAFILTDCDEATKIYYREKYGVEDFTPLVLDKKTPEKRNVYRSRKANHGLSRIFSDDQDVLRFCAQFYQALRKVNQDRRFSITFFLADNTIRIYEKSHPNTGIKPGKFLRRSKVKKVPLDNHINSVRTEYYSPSDFYIGNVLDINGFLFILTSCDTKTLDYMESNKHLFPHSNLELVLDKLTEIVGPMKAEEVVRAFSCKDKCSKGVIIEEDFGCVLRYLSKDALSTHEIETLKRGFTILPKLFGADMKLIQGYVQSQMQNQQFGKIKLQHLEFTFRKEDPCRLGMVDKHTARSILKAANLPIPTDILNVLVSNFPTKDECGRINYCQLLHFLNWQDNFVSQSYPSPVPCLLKWMKPKAPEELSCINYHELLNLICPPYKSGLFNILNRNEEDDCKPYELPKAPSPPSLQNECEPESPSLYTELSLEPMAHSDPGTAILDGECVSSPVAYHPGDHINSLDFYKAAN